VSIFCSPEHKGFPVALRNLSFTVIRARKTVVLVMNVYIDVIRFLRV
jgi:hypothetical protein